MGMCFSEPQEHTRAEKEEAKKRGLEGEFDDITAGEVEVACYERNEKAAHAQRSRGSSSGAAGSEVSILEGGRRGTVMGPEAARAARATAAEVSGTGEEGEGVILYVTSLQAIRKTFYDCEAAIQALGCVRVEVDVRDISASAQTRAEFKARFAEPTPVPRLFVGGKVVGGHAEILELVETERLEQVLIDLGAAFASERQLKPPPIR
mmetsp:Transcript_12833/g.42356  ORF Transcript_12833/g.42356 Transcript_12833/m.42356 type:complete len:207 (+) Transcript_12833:1287-1907(+)